ncbi:MULTISPECIES: YlqD family protein [unclassified Niallia]|uniref:YlqD family protein n=1 Tax=unclassified Niallia TaxID=2837522 RepID=UPI001EDA9F94|nr:MULTISPECIES: YlqD family protein [unclassified Niallia]MDL0434143.1 YlqD family protein [Niallia sp. SS-2023]UPO88905.1 YlqD family protein [Niallia sp. Man26]
MQILQTVTVKQILTEQTKQALEKKLTEELLQLEKECEQFKFEEKKLLKSHPANAIKQQISKRLANKEEKKKSLEFQLAQLHILPLGSELKEQELTGIVDIKVGDVWDEALLHKTILLKDGKVVDIR